MDLSKLGIPSMQEVNAWRRAVPKHQLSTKLDRAVQKKAAAKDDAKKLAAVPGKTIVINTACVECGGPIPRRRASCQRYCSVKCGAKAYADRRRKPRTPCPLCGKPAYGFGRKFCSMKCFKAVQHSKSERTCRGCGRDFVNKNRRRYCSWPCWLASVARKAWVEGPCAHCGTHIRRRTRKRLRLFCGQVCSRAFYLGERHPLWRGNQDPNRGSGWKRLASAIRKRDGYICQRCGRTQEENGAPLQVDHIRPWRSFKDKENANEPTNLASLCARCHGFKTSAIERAWLKGDVLAMRQYERAIKLPPLFAAV